MVENSIIIYKKKKKIYHLQSFSLLTDEVEYIIIIKCFK